LCGVFEATVMQHTPRCKSHTPSRMPETLYNAASAATIPLSTPTPTEHPTPGVPKLKSPSPKPPPTNCTAPLPQFQRSSKSGGEPLAVSGLAGSGPVRQRSPLPLIRRSVDHRRTNSPIDGEAYVPHTRHIRDLAGRHGVEGCEVELQVYRDWQHQRGQKLPHATVH